MKNLKDRLGQKLDQETAKTLEAFVEKYATDLREEQFRLAVTFPGTEFSFLKGLKA